MPYLHRLFSAKEPYNLRKMTCNLRHPMGLRHLVFEICLHTDVCVCVCACVCICNVENKALPWLCRHTMQHSATHIIQHNILHHTAPHFNTLHHVATHCTMLQHTATHCNTLQSTATHCNTLQHTWQFMRVGGLPMA